MITAKKARQLAGETFEEKMENLSTAIEIAARDGQRNLRCGYDYENNPELWQYNAMGDEWIKAKEFLESYGYMVYFDGISGCTIIKW